MTALPFETLPDTFVHPGGFCQNVLATGRCTVTGSDRDAGREAILLDCEHPRTTELAGDRPDYRDLIAVDRATGVIVRLVEIDRRVVTRDADVDDLEPDAPCRRRRSTSSSRPGRRCSTRRGPRIHDRRNARPMRRAFDDATG